MRQSRSILLSVLCACVAMLACSGGKDLATRQQPEPAVESAAAPTAPPAAPPAEPDPREPVSAAELLSMRAAVLRAEDRRVIDDTLREAVSFPDGGVRAAAIRALGRIGGPSALELILERLEDGNPAVRDEVAFALGLLGDPAGRRAVEILSRDTDAGVRARAADALGLMHDPASAGALITLIGDDEFRVSAAACYAATRFASADFAVAPLMRVVDERSETRGLPALHALAMLAVRPLALGVQQKQAVRDRLVGLVRSPNPAVRLMVAVGLRVPASAAEGDVIALLTKDPIAEIRVQAVLALGFPGAPLDPVITGALDDSDDRVALAAVMAMGRMEGLAPLELLSDIVVKDARLWLRYQAALTLAEVEPTLAAGIARGLSKSEEPQLRMASAVLIRGRDDEFCPEIAIRLYEDTFPRVRLAAIPAMAVTEGPLSVALAEVLDESDPAIRIAIANAAELRLSDGGRDESEHADALMLLERLWEAEEELSRSRVQMTILDAAAAGGELPPVKRLLEAGLDSPRREVRVLAITHLQGVFGEDRSSRSGPATDKPIEEYARILEWASQPRAAIVKVMRPGFLPDAFTLALDTASAPLTSWNFAQLAEEGFYDGLTIHRVVPNFVIQDGDPAGDGSGGPGYAIRDEIGASTFQPGTLGMASAGRDLAGSQWFITLTPQPQLNGRYTAFGRIVQNLPRCGGAVAARRPGRVGASLRPETATRRFRRPISCSEPLRTGSANHAPDLLFEIDHLPVDALADLEPALGVDGEERLDHLRVELPAAPARDLLAGGIDAQRGPVGPVRGHRVEGVHDGEDPRPERDLLALQPARIARAVEPLLVAEHDIQRRLEEADVLAACGSPSRDACASLPTRRRPACRACAGSRPECRSCPRRAGSRRAGSRSARRSPTPMRSATSTAYSTTR